MQNKTRTALVALASLVLMVVEAVVRGRSKTMLKRFTMIMVLLVGTSSAIIGQTPRIEFTAPLPRYGTTDDLRGRVYNVNPADYKVAVYIFIEGGGWWTKPYFAWPLTPIQSDSTWTCDITTGGSDIYATGISAFLLPNDTIPPLSGGLPDLPAELYTISVANCNTVRYGDPILFSGYVWWKKASLGLVGPGPNYFSDDSENVWVDGQGYLHLKITQRGGIWYCPEIICKNSFGYGKYTFHVGSQVGKLDKNAVLGLFTWDNASPENHREIDIEFSQWGADEDTNAQYVIQPWNTTGNRHRWAMPESVSSSVHSFDWKTDSIYILSGKDDSIIHQWTYYGPDIPTHGNETPRINLWLNNGIAPTDTSQLEAIITSFNSPGGVSGYDHSIYTPSTFRLSQNYPNPFNSVTTFEFTVQHRSVVCLTLYNILGEKVATLVSKPMNAGKYRTQWNASKAAAGVYFYRLQAGTFTEIKKLILLR